MDSFFCFARDSSANKNTTEGRYVIEMIAEKNNKKEAVYFILMFLTYYGSNALFWEFIVVYLTDAGYTATFAGGLITITYLINLLVQPVVGVFSAPENIAVVCCAFGTQRLPFILCNKPSVAFSGSNDISCCF